MRVLKAILALMLALSMLMPLVACGDEESSSSESSSSESEKQTQHESRPDSEKESQSESEAEESSESEESVSESESESKDPGEQESSSEEENVTPWESNASADVIAEAEALLASKHRLEYNDDGSFRVMIIADAHMSIGGNATDIQEVKDRVKKFVDKIQPNLVILTGDNTINSSSEAVLRANIEAIVGYIEEKEIPWCHVYGNHDHENALANSVQQGIYESFDYCISKDVEELSGTGTYVLGVYNKDGSLGSLVWCIDSGAYASGGGYDYIKQDQIDWYKNTSKLIEEYNNGTMVKGMMAFHIPLIENREANNNKNDPELVYEATGGVNEAMCPSNTDTNLLETIWELGDVKAIVTGHDHVNDYMFNYKGVKLSSSPNISDLTYHTASLQGSRVFDLDTSKLDNVPTYVEYVIERLNPDDFENLEKDTVLEDFEGEFATPVVSGWANEGLSGTATIGKAEGKGVGGSDALSVSRDAVSNFEFVIDISSAGKLGSNKYLVVWMDFTSVEFRKACVGITSGDGDELPYRTDDNDGGHLKYYYLPDGETEWQELTHGTDGCFGWDQDGRVIGQKGYFAFPVDDFRQGANKPNSDTIVWGFYFYGSLWWGESYLNVPFYIDNVMLCEDYLTVELPTE